jgi:hypothetical protein
MESALRDEIGRWHSHRGPDLRDLMHRADRSWQRPVMILSTAGAAALALVLLAAVMLVITAPPLAAAESIRAHLLAH